MVKSSSSSSKNVKMVRCDIEKAPEKELKIGRKVYWKLPFPEPTEMEEEAMEWTHPNPRPTQGGRKVACIQMSYSEEYAKRDILRAHFSSSEWGTVDYTKPATIIDFIKGDEVWEHYITLLCESNDGEFEKVNILNIAKAIDAEEKEDGSDDNYALVQLRKLASIAQIEVKEHRVLKTYHPWTQRTRKKVDKLFVDMWPKLRAIVCDYKEGEGGSHEQNTSHNQFPKEAVRKSVLPMIRYMKRNLNVYGMGLITECMNDKDYDEDDVWTDSDLAKKMQTGAYSVEDEMTYANDGMY